MNYLYFTNLISEGSNGTYLLVVLLGKELRDWDPVIINWFWIDENRN